MPGTVARSDLDHAVHFAKTAVELNESRSDFLAALGKIHHLRGEHEAAADALRKAIELAPAVERASLMRTLDEYQAKEDD